MTKREILGGDLMMPVFPFRVGDTVQIVGRKGNKRIVIVRDGYIVCEFSVTEWKNQADSYMVTKVKG